MVPISLPRSALARLGSADPALAGVIERVGRFRLEIGGAESPLVALVRSIVYQQLAGPAAATIYGRLRALLPARPVAADLLGLEDTELRGAGLSRQKIAALRDLGTRAHGGELALSELEILGDEPIIEKLTTVRGIGRWSAQMFLMFHLGRLDVWPVDDYGLRKAVARLQRRAQLPGRAAMTRRGERYRPWSTVAAWYLWRSLDGG